MISILHCANTESNKQTIPIHIVGETLEDKIGAIVVVSPCMAVLG